MPRNTEPGMPAKGQNGNAKQSRYSRASSGDLGHSVSLSSDAARDTVAAINAVLDAGDAIMLSRTTGGGILAITLYTRGCDPVKFYAKDEDEAQVILADIENAARG